MYQHILLARCIETIALMRNCSKETGSRIPGTGCCILGRMVKLSAMANGAFPVINDSVERLLPEFSELSAALSALGIDQQQPVVAGPQVRLTNDSFECCFDVSGMEPRIVGTRTFRHFTTIAECAWRIPLVDPGTSTYAAGERSRGTFSVFSQHCSSAGR